jgi:hypothetical protein
MSEKHLSVYLNDHLAGAVAAIEILDRLTAEKAALEPALQQLKEDIEADRRQLTMLMDKLKISQSSLRKVGGWFAEQVVETKLAFDDEIGGMLREFERLEALALGIDGKLALWRALQASAELDSRLSGIDYEHLIQRAAEQRGRVEALRIDAARLALTEVGA